MELVVESLLSMGLPYLVVREITILQLWKPSRLKAAQRWACQKKAGMQKKIKIKKSKNQAISKLV